MFRKLRNRFLILHMGIVVLLMFVFFFGILVVNYRNIEGRSIKVINEEGQAVMMPRPPRMLGSSPGQFALIPTFSVELTENNEVSRIFSIFEMSESFYSDITAKAIAKNTESGKISYQNAHFRYKKVDNRLVFLEITKDVDTLHNMALSFLWIMLPMIVIIFLISLYLANRSIRPIEAAFNKQTEFIADASHELKTPLSTISANADVLLASADNEQKKWLSCIKTETKRMESLTGSLLYLTKMEFDKGEAFESVNLSDILENYLITLEAVIYEKKINCGQNIDSEIYAYGNPEQLKRLIVILLDNAIKYTSGDIKISLVKEAHEAKISVFNTGDGISDEDLKRIWDRFYRVDKSREYVGGFGLGLSIARAITNEHKGKIYAESKLSEWARFTVTLPVKGF